MLLKNFGTRNKKKRSLSLLSGSQEPPPRQHQTKEPETTSVRIERQPISPELESEIRYACTLLYYSVEHGVPLPYSHRYQPSTSVREPGKSDPAPAPNVRREYLAPSGLAKNSRDKHDSGIGMDDQPSNQTSASSGTSRFYRQQSQRRLKDWSSPGESGSCSPRSFSTDHWQAGESLARYSNTEAHVGVFQSEDPDWDARSDEVLLDPDTIDMVRRAPSFIWPRSEDTFNRSQHIEDLQPLSPKSRSHSSISHHIHPNEPGAYPEDTQNRPETTTTTTAPPQTKHQGVSGGVIVNNDGHMHVMSAAEEAERQSDLQRAVKEKMRTGIIGANSSWHESKTTQHEATSRFPTLPKSFQSQSLDQKPSAVSSGVDLGYSQTQAQCQPQPRRAKSGLLKRLSMINIGRRKTDAAAPAHASRERDSVGLSRIVEAV